MTQRAGHDAESSTRVARSQRASLQTLRGGQGKTTPRSAALVDVVGSCVACLHRSMATSSFSPTHRSHLGARQGDALERTRVITRTSSFTSIGLETCPSMPTARYAWRS